MSPTDARDALHACHVATEQWQAICAEYWPRLRGGQPEGHGRHAAAWTIEVTQDGTLHIRGWLTADQLAAGGQALTLAEELGVDVVRMLHEPAHMTDLTS